MLLNIFDDTSDVHNALSSPVSGFHRDDNAVGGTKCSETHNGETRRAIKDNELVLVSHPGNRFDKRKMQIGLFPLCLIGDIEVRECASCRENINVRIFGFANEWNDVGI